MRRYGARDLVVRIELELVGDVAPQPANSGHGARSDQFDELVRTDDKTAFGIHLPNEAQRMAPLCERLVAFGGSDVGSGRRSGRRLG